MKTLFLVMLSCHLAIFTRAQKPVLDETALFNWPTLGYEELSPDGKHVMYSINTAHNGQFLYHLVIQSTDNTWHDTIDKAKPPYRFSADGRKSIYTTDGDSLVIQTLGTSQRLYVPNIRSFTYRRGDSAKWIAYNLSDSSSNLYLLDLTNNTTRIYSDIKKFQFSADGRTILLVSKNTDNSLLTVKWVDLQTDQTWAFWNGKEAHNFVFDQNNSKLSFLAQNDNNLSSLWLYNRGQVKAIPIVDGDTLYQHQQLKLSNIIKFSPTCDLLQINLATTPHPIQSKPQKPLVIIWKYSDPLLAPQLNAANPIKNLTALVDLNGQGTRIIQRENERLLGNTDDVSLLNNENAETDYTEWYWNPAAHKKFIVENNQTGARNVLAQWKENLIPHLSPDGKFVVYFDPIRRIYVSYETSTGSQHSITPPHGGSWIDTSIYSPDDIYTRTSPMGWIPEENTVLLTDPYDIYKIDCRGHKPPINLTGSIRKNRPWIFTLQNNRRQEEFHSGSNILVSAFDDLTKQSALYCVPLTGSTYKEYISMGDYIFELGQFASTKDSTCILRRMSARNSINLFFTNNFRSVSQLSQNEPEKQYNWLTTELINWKNSDGTTNQGILYKPENFDSHKKYPLIFYCYERLSENLNKYLQPAFADGPMNIPWMVSRGYLVFTPDIHYISGQPGQSAFNAIMSAANLLSQRSYVDKFHMGLQGHSFGGYETNYVVTHTSLFAAACSAAGLSDLTAEYGTIWERGASRQGMHEKGQLRMNAAPWQNKERYVSNSPIYQVNKVTTPMLLLHNRLDDHVDFFQGASFFLALRRLQKPSWMLEYPGEKHLLDNITNAVDFNRKMTEFFDHYLKDAPMPSWMIN